MSFGRFLGILVFATFCFSWGVSFGQPGVAPSEPNLIGLYADPECGAEYVDGVQVGDMVTAYVIATNPTDSNTDEPIVALGGVEFGLSVPSGVTVLSLEWPVDCINVGTNTDVIVGLGQPLSCAEGYVVLCTYTFFVLQNDPKEFYLTPFSVPSLPNQMVLLDSTEQIHPAGPASGSWDEPVFGINTGPLWSADFGTIVIDAEPDLINAPWSLNSLDGFQQTGHGDTTIPGVPVGTYVLTWGPVPGYDSPAPNPIAQVLEVDQTITFLGEYTGPGEIVIDPAPASISAPWTLEGPDDSILTGNGPQTYPEMDPGTYTLTWGEVPGWITPDPAVITEILFTAQTVTFAAEYLPLGEIYIDTDPDELGIPWTLTGPEGFLQAGEGDASIDANITGVFTLTLEPIMGWVLESANPQVEELVYQGSIEFLAEYTPRPALTSVTDVPDDQGRQVRLIWNRCAYDAPDQEFTVTEYGIYREQTVKKKAGKLAGWDFVGSVPARGDDVYQFVAPTLCDSTITGGLCESTFMVSAMTASPFVFFDSDPASGYSVDNLQPVQPGGFTVDFAFDGNQLSWAAPLDPDVDHYLVYRGTTGEFDTAEQVAQVEGTAWSDDLKGEDPWDYSYWVVAVDHSGNRSEPTDWGSAQISGAGDTPLPSHVALYGAAPNPFNPATTIRFDLPRRSHVSLSVYSIDGRLVARLLDEVKSGGRHEAVWQGMDTAGRTVASGTYVYRLEAGDVRLQKTMTLLK